MRIVTLLVMSSVVGGCAPTWYDGEFGVIEAGESVVVTRQERFLGDCFRLRYRVPTAYVVTRTGYSITLVHGQRYWPEFFAEVEGTEGRVLSLAGESVRPVEYPDGGDMRRLRSERGASSLSFLLRPDPTASRLQFDVLDSEGAVVGSEALPVDVRHVRCFEWDAV